MRRDKDYFYRVLRWCSAGISVLWLIHGFRYWSDVDLHLLGIYPRKLTGSIGILTSGLVHQDAIHLFSNTFPLLFLSLAIAYFYRALALRLFLVMYLLTGLMVWLFGREAFHIGASGLIYSMIGFLLISGLVRKEPQSMGISLAFLFLYGGVLQGMFPSAVSGNVSWESHLLGAVTGGVCAFYYRDSAGPESLTDEDDDDNHGNGVDFTGEDIYQYNYKRE